MKFNRRVYIVASLFLALFLITANAYAATFTVNVGPGGSLDLIGKNKDGETVDVQTTPKGMYLLTGIKEIIFTMTPGQFLQVSEVLLDAENGVPEPSVLEYCTSPPNSEVLIYHWFKPDPDPYGDHQLDVSFAAIPVEASFSVSPSTEGEATYPIQFTDTTDTSINGVDSWTWDFGDGTSIEGTTPAVQNPVHIYATPGNYVVTLTAENTQNGAKDITEPMVYSVVQPTITYQTTAGPNGSISAAGPDGKLLTPLGGLYTVPEHTTTTFTIIPNEDYQVASVQAIDESGTVVYDYDTETSVVFDGSTDVNDYTIVASFEPIQTGTVKLEGISKQYSTLQVAYDAAVIDEGLSEATLRIHGGEALPQNLVFNLDLIVTLLGGYDDTFENLDPANPYTIIDGTITIRAGTVTISDLIIGPSQI